jgi:hypothetical protein
VGCGSDAGVDGPSTTVGEISSTSARAPDDTTSTTATTSQSTAPPTTTFNTIGAGAERSGVDLPPERCDAEPVTQSVERSIVALGLCGDPSVSDTVLYPIGRSDNVQDALQLVVDGTDGALLKDGVWTGFDRIPMETRQRLEVATELDDAGALTITINLDGEVWKPPADLRSGPTDHSFFALPILWTAFSDPAVTQVDDPICLLPSGDANQEICPDSTRLQFEEFVEDRWGIDAQCAYTWWIDKACRDE